MMEVLAALLAQAAPEGRGEVIFSAADRETRQARAAVDAANANDRRSADAFRRNGGRFGAASFCTRRQRGGQLRL